MSAPTRQGPAPAGRPSVTSTSQGTATPPKATANIAAESPIGYCVGSTIATPLEVGRASVLRLTGDAEAMALDLLDRIGPAACAALAVWLVELAREVGHRG